MEINKINSIMKNLSPDTVLEPLNKAQDKSFEEKLKAAMEKNDQEELKKVSKQFEGIMLDILFKQMKATINRSDLVERDPGSDIFESMLDESLMEKASQVSTFGLADALYKQLSRRAGATVKADGEKTAEGVGPVDK